MSEPTQTEIRPSLQLAGADGNAFAILCRASIAARRSQMTNEEWKEIRAEAMAGDYDHLLQTIMKHFDTY